jgi:hypothetical protein
MSSIRAAALIVVGAWLSGCAAMSKEECRTVDWRTVGYEDGVAGRAGDRIGDYRRACAEHGVVPDLAAYRAGRDDGLREFCQPHNGYRAGASGLDYAGDCPADLAPAFERGYDVGRELYVRNRRVSDTVAAIDARRAEIDELESSIAGHAVVLIGDDSTAQERTEAVIDSKQAAQRIGRLHEEIASLERDRAAYEQELEAYRRTVPANY